MSQTPAVIVVQNGTAVSVDNVQPQANVFYVQQATKTTSAYSQGRFGQNVNMRITKLMGDLLIVCGVLSVIGSVLETAAFAIQLAGQSAPIEYSLSHYAGYWCGVLIIASGSVATHSAKNISDCMVIADVVAAGTGVVFAVVLLALSAKEMTDIIKVNDSCQGQCGTFVPLMLASYSLMITGSSLALIFAAVLGVFTVLALVKGLCRENNIGTM